MHPKQQEEATFFEKISLQVSTGIGNFFYRLGFLIAQHPWNTIIVSVLLALSCCVGLVQFYNEKDPLKLWVPEKSQLRRDTLWLLDKFEEGTRIQNLLITAPDVLQPEVIQKLMRVHEAILEVKTSGPLAEGLNELCYKVPIIAGHTVGGRSKRSLEEGDEEEDEEEEFDGPYQASVHQNKDEFCDLVASLPRGCMLESLLELWNLDRSRVDSLTKRDIVRELNRTRISPYTGYLTSFEHLLSGIERDSTGKIVAAKAMKANYMLHVNFSLSDLNKVGNVMGAEHWASESTVEWEKEFLKKMAAVREELNGNGFELFYSAERSYSDIILDSLWNDTDRFALGALIMFLYMYAVLSRCSWTEIRVLFGSIGLFTVGLAFMAGLGICAVLGLPYGTLHTTLPYLLMGLGVDDIFVMMACWRKVQACNGDLSLQERMGLMLQHSGASITITTLTDIMAFAVGASTVLPVLQSFCLYAVVGVTTIYLLVVTFFVAVFTLDERRIAVRHNSFLPCIVHTEQTSKPCIQKNYMHNSITYIYSKIILTKPGKIIILVSVICLTAFNMRNLLNLRQRFDHGWFVPDGTYLNQFITASREYYPDSGYEASVLLGQLNYTQEISKIIQMSAEIENQTAILHEVTSWVEPFHRFVELYHKKDITKVDLTDAEWHQYLSEFLYSYSGGKFQAFFRFEEPLTCGKPTPNVTVSLINFKFKRFFDREEYLPAKLKIENIVADTHLDSGDGFSSVWGKIFVNWMTDEIIDHEIYRNIFLALIGVMACTAIIIVSLKACFWIFLTVLITLINVGGSMSYIGLTLEVTSCLALQMSVGLCVDYASHICHTYLTVKKGTKDERVLATVQHIAAAVIYGGGSTILALVTLSTSQVYILRAFFQIFLLVIGYGVFNGVVLLPVILSVAGPDPYGGYEKAEKKENGAENETELSAMMETTERGEKGEM